jgi:hypothetical protein
MDDVKLGSYKFSAEYQDIKVESPKLDIIDGIRLFPMRFGIYCDKQAFTLPVSSHFSMAGAVRFL